MKNAISHVKFYALAVVALLTVSSAPVRAQHDMSNMPGMSQPKPKPKPGATAAKRKQPAQQKLKQDNANDMDGMDNTPAPAPVPSPSPEPTDANMPGMKMPTTTTSSPTPAPSSSPTPSPSPLKMEMNMPGMQIPQTSVTPNANQTQPQSTHDNMGGMGSMDMGATNENAQPSGMAGMVMGSSGMITSRAGSGTSWQPASTPMHMLHWQSGDWIIMLHGDAKVGVNSQGGPRGVTKFESENWLMAMASRRVGPGTLDLRSMFSFEPFTLSPGGSPELFQTGETYKGQPLVDKQHPHDLFMTLSAAYTLPIGERGSWFAYVGFPGEPALGPIAFMHRTSASENPAAPLAHHLEDSTHISYGVFTTGFTYRWFKMEGSVFNGREPDENRYNFEFNPWNSRSVRVSFAPNKNWAMQVSYGFLKHPEAAEPGDVRRTTASISYNKPLKNGNWATTLIWGRNHISSPDHLANLNGYTAESTVNFMHKNYLYTRLELVDKNELLLPKEIADLGLTGHPSFRIGAYTFGAARDVWNTDKYSVALGGDVTFYSKPAVLDSVYGNDPISYHFFVRFRLSGKGKQ